MLPKYEHTQKGGFPFWLTVVIAIIVFPILFTEATSMFLLVFFGVLVIWALLMMSGLTVQIDEDYIRIRFGPGVFFKKFPLSKIVACEPKHKTHCLGWGVRYYFGGWLYNVAGFKSVEIIFKNGKKARIGTDEPEKLAEAIQDAIGQTSTAAV